MFYIFQFQLILDGHLKAHTNLTRIVKILYEKVVLYAILMGFLCNNKIARQKKETITSSKCNTYALCGKQVHYDNMVYKKDTSNQCFPKCAPVHSSLHRN